MKTNEKHNLNGTTKVVLTLLTSGGLLLSFFGCLISGIISNTTNSFTVGGVLVPFALAVVLLLLSGMSAWLINSAE